MSGAVQVRNRAARDPGTKENENVEGHESFGKGLGSDYLGGVIEQRDIAVWAAAALLAIGMGWSRYAKAKSRNNLVRQLAAMNVEQRKKMLSRMNPTVALEIRQELLERFRIMT